MKSLCKSCHKSRYRSSPQQKAIKQQQMRAWREKNREANLLLNRKYRASDPKRYYSYVKAYRAALNRATPWWLTKSDKIELKWAKQIAKTWTKARGQEYHADHVIPLRGKNVCGLNVPWNISIITKAENSAKFNKFEGAL